MEDSFYYKVRSIENDVQWLAATFKREGFEQTIPSEEKRKAIRVMIANIHRHVETIQSHLGSEFTPEF